MRPGAHGNKNRGPQMHGSQEHSSLRSKALQALPCAKAPLNIPQLHGAMLARR